MSKEKFIHGKHDDANHVGLYHNRRMEQAAEAHLAAFLRGDFNETETTIPISNSQRGASESGQTSDQQQLD